MKLIGSLTSPFVRKVRVVLAEKKLDCTLVPNNVWEPGTDIAHYNPLGKVPCLLMEGGEAVFDSRVIVEYLDALSPVGKLIPSAGRERAEVKTWEALADGVLDAAILIRLEHTFSGRTEAQRSPEWIAHQRRKVDQGLKAMSLGLGEQTYCVNQHLSLADIAVGCTLAWLEFRFPDMAWRTEYPNLSQLLNKLSLRPSFIDTQPPVA